MSLRFNKKKKKKKNKCDDNTNTIMIDQEAFIKKKSELGITDPAIQLEMDKKNGSSIVMFQKVSAATVLIDEELEQTLDNFLTAAESVRFAVMVVPNRNKRRLLISSWFQKEKI